MRISLKSWTISNRRSAAAAIGEDPSGQDLSSVVFPACVGPIRPKNLTAPGLGEADPRSAVVSFRVFPSLRQQVS
ncbi:MAG: hypothetical protein R2787_17545 [Saprospiraceae bacterium]